MAKNRRLYFSLFILLALVVVAYFTAKKNGWFDSKAAAAPQSDFAIEDTLSIDKFIITKSNNEKAVLTREADGTWKINGKYRAKPESVSMLMVTFRKVEVRSRVGAAARNNIVKNMASYNRKVEIFQNGKWTKTWYVGNPTSGRLGTYMLLETPETGKSSEPFIMSLAGFHGQLDIRFFTKEEDWRYTGIHTIMPEKLKSVKVVNRDRPEDGFTLNVLPNRKLQLLDHNGGKISTFDTITARAYTYLFKKVHYEHLARQLKFDQIDSLRKEKPYYILEVTTTDNHTHKMPIYQMFNRGGEDDVDLEGKPLKFNPEKAYALLPEGDAVVIQYYVFDKLLRPVSSFIKPEGGLLQDKPKEEAKLNDPKDPKAK